jgi:23S rRNA (guanosine2251-2'-O)-methyltransferase
MNKLALVVHNVRSCHNVGSILRSADAFGVEEVFLTGYTPYPALKNDSRLPHLAAKISRQIHKTALGAEETLNWRQESDVFSLINQLRQDGYAIIALEQTPEARNLADFSSLKNTALIVGREVEGIEPEVLKVTDEAVQIPMLGQKESLNVAVAAAIALYHLKPRA